MKYSSSYFPIGSEDALIYDWSSNLEDSDFNLEDVPGITAAIAHVLTENGVENSIQLIGTMMTLSWDDVYGIAEYEIEQFMKILMDKGVLDDSGLITIAVLDNLTQNYGQTFRFSRAKVRDLGQEMLEDYKDRRVALTAAMHRNLGRHQNVHRMIDSFYLP